MTHLNNILMNSVDESVIIFNEKGIINYINDSACRFFEISYDDALHSKFSSLMPSDVSQNIIKKIKSHSLVFKEKGKIQINRFKKDIEYSVNTYETLLNEKNTVLILSDISDVHERELEQVRARQDLEKLNLELQQSQSATLNILEDVEQAHFETEKEKNKIQTILQGLSDAVMVLDKKNRVVLFNTAAERLTNIKSKKLLNKNPFKSFHFEDESSGEIVQLKLNGNNIKTKIAKLRGKIVLVRKGSEEMPI